ncbi:MAG TPA: VOC family protein [Gemmatimonadota bacterium]|jgi:uncharacterized glyoxalase superfamily protein PhnB
MAIQGARPHDRRITPHLFVRDAAAAIEFYRRAFGARELYRSPMPGGAGLHAQLRIADSTVMVSDESPDHPELGLASPETRGGASVALELYVPDVDTAYRRAVDAGATATCPPFDAFFGDRYGQLRDPWGHVWALAQRQETLTPEQVAERMQGMLTGA